MRLMRLKVGRVFPTTKALALDSSATLSYLPIGLAMHTLHKKAPHPGGVDFSIYRFFDVVEGRENFFNRSNSKRPKNIRTL